MPAKMTRKDDMLEIALAGHPEFKKALASIKAIPGRRWDPETKNWCIPAEPDLAERVLVTVKPEVDPVTLQWIRTEKAARAQELVTKLPEDAEVDLPWADRLYPYQRSFIAFAATHPAVLLADDMGLGKTVQAISAVIARRAVVPDQGATLIVCPKSVKGVWQREIRFWAGKDEQIFVADGAKPKRQDAIRAALAEHAWLIVNWEQIRAKEMEMIEPLLRGPWASSIADEAHRAKNRKAQVAHGLWQIQSQTRLALTGTPLQNSPDELWALLRWLYPEQYGRSTPGSKTKPAVLKTPYWAFYDMYCDFYEGNYGKIVTGVKNADALRFELKGRLVRRTKGEVLDLPPKVRQTIPITLLPAQRKIYKEAEEKLWFSIKQAIEQGDKSAEAFAKAAAEAPESLYRIPNGAARTVRLRQVASSPALLGGDDVSAKLDAAVEIITDAQPKQIVVFSEFVVTCRILAERLRSKGLTAAVFTGDVSETERTAIEDSFQAGNIDVVIGTIAAMREGITLHAADTVIFIERHWTPAWNEQAEDRLHRVGQESKVTVLILEAQDTVDASKVNPTNAIKSLIVSSVIQKDHVREEAIP